MPTQTLPRRTPMRLGAASHPISTDLLRTTIGLLDIYAEQVRAAQRIMDIFHQQQGPPLLVAEPQEGKTGTVILVIDKFIKNCKAQNLTYEVVFLNNIADNELLSQTKKRLLKAGYSADDLKIRLIHHAALRNDRFEPNLNVDRRLIIIDECHIALGEDRPFDSFLQACGVMYGEPIYTWDEPNNYVLSVSATPFAHVIVEKLQRCFLKVVLDTSPDYYSIRHLADATITDDGLGGKKVQYGTNSRVRKSDQVVRDGKVTKFFAERMKEFLEVCERDGNGHLVIRVTSDAPEIIAQYVRATYPDTQIDIQVFESQKLNNISELEGHLVDQYMMPCITIIKGSLRAGKTLGTTKYIRAWIEPPKSKADTLMQVLGRSLGYEMIDGADGKKHNRKFADKFIIYCNVNQLDDPIMFYAAIKGSGEGDVVPRGTWNKKAGSRTRVPQNPELMAQRIVKVWDIPQAVLDRHSQWSRDGISPIAEFANGLAEVKAYRAKVLQTYTDAEAVTAHKEYVRNCSGNEKIDLAACVLHKTPPHKNTVLYMDGPANIEGRQESFAQADAQYHLRGKLVMVMLTDAEIQYEIDCRNGKVHGTHLRQGGMFNRTA